MGLSAFDACIGLGSNLGDRRAHLEGALAALAALPGTRLAARSSFYESDPLPAPGVEVGGPYLNAAAVLSTTLTPRALLAALHDIERARGRDRRAAVPRWSPRTLDLDLLLYGDEVINEEGLTVPHPRLQERAFVVVPLAEIAPAMRVARTGRTVRELLKTIDAAGVRTP